MDFLRHCDNGLATLRYNKMKKDYNDKTFVKSDQHAICRGTSRFNFYKGILIRVKAEIRRADKYILLKLKKLQGYDVCMISKNMRKDPKRKILLK